MDDSLRIPVILDSSLLAFVLAHTGYIWNGSELEDLATNSFAGSLSWVPGQEIVAYVGSRSQQEKSLALVRKAGDSWNVSHFLIHESPNYAWLPNGHLAVVSETSDDRGQGVTIFGWK